jgi:hypothetical protein
MIWPEYQGGNRADTAAGAPQPAFGTVKRETSHLTLLTCAADPVPAFRCAPRQPPFHYAARSTAVLSTSL